MQRAPISALRDLLTATEAVRDDETIGRSFSNCGQEFQFSNGNGCLVFIRFKAERSGHTAATRGWSLEIDFHLAQDRFFGRHSHHSLVMAMPVNQCFARQFRQLKMSCLLLEELAQQECLPRKPLSSLVFGEQVQEFITKHCGAARLQNNDWSALLNFGFERGKNLAQKILGAIQHAPIVERAPATQVGFRKSYAITGRFENVDGSSGGVREKVVVEGVRPQEHS